MSEDLSNMIISYQKLWILLQKNKMKKSDLAIAAGISPYTMTKLNKGLLRMAAASGRRCGAKRPCCG